MRKSTIWIIGIVMGITFVALLFLQLIYIDSMVKMKKEQFDESVNSALSKAARNQELNETLGYLEDDIRKTQDFIPLKKNSAKIDKLKLKLTGENFANNNDKSMQEIIRNRYIYQKALLDEVVFSVLYTASDKPLQDRMNFSLLDHDLRTELANNGINIPYHFIVSTADGREVYRCPDFVDDGSENTYTQELYRNGPPSKMGVVKVHFPDMNSYIFSSVKFVIPSIIFTVVLLLTFIFTILAIFRQKRVSEMRNDFINNMTHELKTPISSISLAAQMLIDSDVSKSPVVMGHVSKVITDESKRLRLLVDKVLQMSLFDKAQSVLKKKELDINKLVTAVVDTFDLKVGYSGGEITTNLKAKYPQIYADEVHFTNVIFNLLDNAVKYRREDVTLELVVSTWNDDKHLFVSIQDNGIGIKKDNLKKIFEKFYRVHTGNVHNVKGFGLGLAYVKRIVEEHGGAITAESEQGKGTKFIISMPIDITDKE